MFDITMRIMNVLAAVGFIVAASFVVQCVIVLT